MGSGARSRESLFVVCERVLSERRVFNRSYLDRARSWKPGGKRDITAGQPHEAEYQKPVFRKNENYGQSSVPVP